MKKNKVKVLIIDDNFSILQYLKTLFERYDFEVKTCIDGYEGLQNAAEFKPDIIFLDLMMPNIDGIKMLQLKKVLNDIKDIPVVVISANAGRNNTFASIEAGADRVLSKPINVKQLQACVDELLGGKNFERNNKIIDNDFVINTKNVEELKSKINKETLSEIEDKNIKILRAIRNRDIQSLKNNSEQLKLSLSNINFNKINLLDEISKTEYIKPSDWMYAELKLKEFTKEINNLFFNKVI